MEIWGTIINKLLKLLKLYLIIYRIMEQVFIIALDKVMDYIQLMILVK